MHCWQDSDAAACEPGRQAARDSVPALSFRALGARRLGVRWLSEYWQKSLRFFADAPLIGNGPGSTLQLFERDAVGQTGLAADVTANPHNQTLNVAIQWGLIGIVVFYGM
jgi:O-antigen ligase